MHWLKLFYQPCREIRSAIQIINNSSDSHNIDVTDLWLTNKYRMFHRTANSFKASTYCYQRLRICTTTTFFYVSFENIWWFIGTWSHNNERGFFYLSYWSEIFLEGVLWRLKIHERLKLLQIAWREFTHANWRMGGRGYCSILFLPLCDRISRTSLDGMWGLSRSLGDNLLGTVGPAFYIWVDWMHY